MDLKSKTSILSFILLMILPSAFANPSMVGIGLFVGPFILLVFLFDFCWNTIVAFLTYKIAVKGFFDKMNYSKAWNLIFKITIVGLLADGLGLATMEFNMGNQLVYISFFVFAFWIFIFEFLLMWKLEKMDQIVSAKMALSYALFSNPAILYSALEFLGSWQALFLLGSLIFFSFVASLIWKKLSFELKKGKRKKFGLFTKFIIVAIGLPLLLEIPLFLLTPSGPSLQLCNEFQATVDALCSTRMNRDSCENAIPYPGQLGTDEQCTWQVEGTLSSCVPNTQHPNFDWSDNEEGACR